LPDETAVREASATGWTGERYDAAKSLILALREHHDRDAPQTHPHAALINTTGARLREKDVASSLASGWALARDIDVTPANASPLTPMTRLAPSIRVFLSPSERVFNDSAIAAAVNRDKIVPLIIPPLDDSVRANARRGGVSHAALAAAVLVVVALFAVAAPMSFPDVARVVDRAQTWFAAMRPHTASAVSSSDTPKSVTEPAAGTERPQVANATAVDSATPSTAAAEALPAKTDATEPDATSPISDSPLPAATHSEPVETNPLPNAKPTNPVASPASRPPVGQVASTSPSPAPVTSKRTLPANKTASANAQKATAISARSLAAQSPKATPSTKATQRAFSFSPANRIASSAHGVLPTSIGTKADSLQTRALALAESRPASPQVALVAPPSVEHDVDSQPPLLMPSSAPSIAADRQEQSAALQIAETPTPPPSPTHERARSSRTDRIADQGWFSRLLQLVGKKAAPIEDRRLQATTPKKPANEAAHSPSSAQQLAQSESLPSIGQPKVAIAQSLPRDVIPAPPTHPNLRDDSKPLQREASRMGEPPAKIPSPYAALPMRIPEVPAESEATDRDTDQIFASEARRALRQVVPRIAAQA